MGWFGLCSCTHSEPLKRFPVPQSHQSKLLLSGQKSSCDGCVCTISHCKPHINTVSAYLCQRKLALNVLGGGLVTEERRGSSGKDDLRWSRRLQPIQEVNTVLRSASHGAPAALNLWNPCEGLVWSVCIPVWIFLRKGQLNIITTPTYCGSSQGRVTLYRPKSLPCNRANKTLYFLLFYERINVEYCSRWF